MTHTYLSGRAASYLHVSPYRDGDVRLLLIVGLEPQLTAEVLPSLQDTGKPYVEDAPLFNFLYAVSHLPAEREIIGFYR